MYAIVARYYAQDGKEEEVAEILRMMIPIALSEPGCKMYAINRAPDDPRRFLLYEQYVDEAAFASHAASEPVQRNIVGRVIPMLESRVREVYETIDPA
jgi:autoinducer 2-degrading protein